MSPQSQGDQPSFPSVLIGDSEGGEGEVSPVATAEDKRTLSSHRPLPRIIPLSTDMFSFVEVCQEQGCGNLFKVLHMHREHPIACLIPAFALLKKINKAH